MFVVGSIPTLDHPIWEDVFPNAEGGEDADVLLQERAVDSIEGLTDLVC